MSNLKKWENLWKHLDKKSRIKLIFWRKNRKAQIRFNRWRVKFKVALKDKDIKEVADALTDILYVTYGAGHAFGIDLDKCFEEVQNSNMSKLGDDGKPIYNEFGKVMKGPNYFKPNLEKFINER